MILKLSPTVPALTLLLASSIPVGSFASKEPNDESRGLLRGDDSNTRNRKLQTNCSLLNGRACKRDYAEECMWDSNNGTCKSRVTAPPTACPNDNESLLQVDVLTDNYPSETSWTLKNKVCTTEEWSEEESVLWTNTGTLDSATDYSYSNCVPRGEYTFTVCDTFGDGFCCGYGQGKYILSYGAFDIKEGGAFAHEESVTIGSCDPTAAPTKRPTDSPSLRPTERPTDSPTLKPTKSPTFSPTEAPTNAPRTMPPTVSPTKLPTSVPTTLHPTVLPTKLPTTSPSLLPTHSPTKRPITNSPTVEATLTNQIICGYQGWFAFPGDGAPINRWKHWFNSPTNKTHPTIDEVRVDLYPTTDEYDDADLHETGIPMQDGASYPYAKFYSAARPNVVKKHFEWMETYGISGVFHMRFMESIHLEPNRDWKTMVLNNVKNAAEATGRVFAVSYNIAGNTLNNTVLDDLKEDWKRLVDEERIIGSDRYIKQDGLPVLRIYGIGFKAVKVDDTDKLKSLIDWFQDPPKGEEQYRVFLIGGVPSRWRERISDSRSGTAWKNIYNSLDGIHPWHVGRWSHINGLNANYNNIIKADAQYCKNKEILYMPTMWPGFSWHNLKNGAQGVNGVPRLGGDFMWKQAYNYAKDPNINTVWMAQFDESDEGTSIYKVTARTKDLPQGTWLALDTDGHDLPSDWYLRLTGEAQKMLDGRATKRVTIPISP